jgi:RNA polymerase sigma-70 factor (ECF subfamily)
VKDVSPVAERTGRRDELADRRTQRAIAGALAESVDGHFEEFVAKYQHRLFGFVLTLVGNAGEAEEIAQDTFVAAYRALRSYDAPRRRALALRAWLFTIALNKVRNRARRAPATSLDEALADGRIALQDSDLGPAALVERDERTDAVRRALAALAPRYRMPVVLRHLEGFSYDEIAELLEQPAGTAKANVHRGLALLRASAELEGATS